MVKRVVTLSEAQHALLRVSAEDAMDAATLEGREVEAVEYKNLVSTFDSAALTL